MGKGQSMAQLKQKIRQQTRTIRALRARIANENDAMINFMGGLSKFGYGVLLEVSERVNFKEVSGNTISPAYMKPEMQVWPNADEAQWSIWRIANTARLQGWLEYNPHSLRHVVTQLCEEIADEGSMEAGPAGESAGSESDS